MSAFLGAVRPGIVLPAALLVWSLGAASPRAEEPASPHVRSAAAETVEPFAAGRDATPVEPADTKGTVATTPDRAAPSDFREPLKEEPATAEAPTTPPKVVDPLSGAVVARLSDARPLIQRFPVKQREAMQAYYATVDNKPVWIADGAFTPAAKSVMARLRAAAEDALDPNAYPIPTLTKPASEAEIADADLRLSAAALLYARDARGGRINLAAISQLITPKLDLPSAEALLPELVGAGEAAGTKLQGYNPQTAGYLALRKRLAANRDPAPAATEAKSLRLPVGPVLKVGMTDPRVPELRRFFGLPERTPGTLDAAPGEPESYDADVAKAVAGFQRGHDLPESGHLTRSTIVALALASTPESRFSGDEAPLVVNMERWRWLPGQLGDDYVLVNVPEYRLRVYRGGVVRDETRVIVGKTESPTPLFSGAMEYAVVNPSWFVPPSILKTMLASGRTGGFEVIRRGGQISLRQPPGERNALGFIKFLFPNQHSVYLHDTPNRSLFSASKRAMSHGCVRVDDPFRFADAVLPDEWSEARLKKLIGRGERTINLSAKLPVHLAYFTAYLDDSGVYRTLPDIYGYDARMKSALGLGGGSTPMATAPVEPKRVVANVSLPAAPRRVSSRRAAGATQAPYRDPYGAAPVQEARQVASSRARRPADVYGEPGLWTPELQPRTQPRSWW